MCAREKKLYCRIPPCAQGTNSTQFDRKALAGERLFQFFSVANIGVISVRRCAVVTLAGLTKCGTKLQGEEPNE